MPTMVKEHKTNKKMSAAITNVVQGITEDGNFVEIEATEAYYTYRLTMEDLFRKEDCDKVISSMEELGIVKCQDAKDVLEIGYSRSFFSIEDVLNRRILL